MKTRIKEKPIIYKRRGALQAYHALKLQCKNNWGFPLSKKGTALYITTIVHN